MNDEALSLRTFRVIHNSYQAIITALKLDMKNYDMNDTEFMVMELLLSKGPQTIQTVAKKINLTSGSMTYVVKELIEKDFLQKERCKTDNRVWYLTLTETGKKIIQSALLRHSSYVNELFSPLTELEKQQLIMLLKKIGLLLKKEI